MKTISLFGKGAVSGYILFVLMALCSISSAQQPPHSNQSLITGQVYDSAGAIMDASVSVLASDVVVYTSEDGSYSISASASDVLVFAYPGYASVEVLVGSQLVIDVELVGASVALEEAVINAGYYTVKDRERTGSISRVVASDIENQPVGNVLSAVQGRMAGVQIVQNSGVPGGGFQVQIRGINSLRLDGNLPLYIIDGVLISPSSPSDLSGTILPYNEINPLNALNPNDIESIEVLKDADATSIYGSRGANGVILVTTKKGKYKKTSFSLNTNYGVSRVINKLKMMNTAQYLGMRMAAFSNDGITELPANAYDVNGTWDTGRFTDWQEALIGGTAINSLIQLSINGGSEQTGFLVSASHNEQTTVFPADFRYKTNNLSANLNHRSLDKKFEMTVSTLFSTQQNNVLNDDLTRFALSLSPNAPALYNDDGSLNWEDGTFNNPVASFGSQYSYDNKNLNTNINLSYQLFPMLKLKLNSGFNQSTFQELSLRPHTINNPAYGMTSQNSMAFKNKNERFSYLVEPQLDFSYAFRKHQLSVLAGASFQQLQTSIFGVQGYGFESNSLITNIAAAKTIVVGQDHEIQYNYAALFARINYQFDNKYILNLTGRRDGSSRFGPNNRFAYFGAVGAAWLFSKESFLQDVSWLSFGKLRASYGTTGSDLIGDYQYLDSYTISSNLYGGLTTMNPSRLFNPDYSWERTTKLEFALEAGFIKDRINLSAAWYRNLSKNQLLGIPLPGTTGFNNILANLPAEIENTGIELEVGLVPIRTTNLRWESSFNISFPKNRLVDFPNLEGSTYANRFVIGSPVTAVKVYNFEGINPETGQYEFTDYNGDGRISSPDDNQVIENIGVRYFGGWSNEINYKRLSFSFLFQFVKQKQWNYNNMLPTPGIQYNMPVEVLDVWSAENPGGSYMPYTTLGNVLHGYFSNSTAAISDASFIRLKNIQLSYRLPVNSFLSDVMIYLQGQNLLTITDYFGMDPEFLQAGFLPPLKTYSLGVQLNF